MAWADAHGTGFRGVYRGPNGAKLKTKTFKSRSMPGSRFSRPASPPARACQPVVIGSSSTTRARALSCR